MKRLLLSATLALAACSAEQPGAPEDLAGRWDVQLIANQPLGESVDIWIDIDPQTGAARGFSGCAEFTAPVRSFGRSLSFGAVTKQNGACPSAEAANDEARFLTVLPAVRRQIRHGRSLELLDAGEGAEALVRLRLSDTPTQTPPRN